MDACVPARGHSDMGAAAVALEKAQLARNRILDGLSGEEWDTLVAAGYRVVDSRECG